jgi:hypothetical protein
MPRKPKPPAEKKHSYLKTRFNATKHGVLSKLQVLPWEDPKELEDLQEQFIKEYNPQGITERFLTLELANLIFRKQRLYAAENAIVFRQLREINNHHLAGESALYNGSIKPSEKHIDLGMVVYQDSKANPIDIAETKEYISFFQELIASDISYKDMLESCPDDTIKVWNDYLENDLFDRYFPNQKSFVQFLQERVIDFQQAHIDTIQAIPYIKQQAIGLAHVPEEKYETSLRYETTIDRRFERLLSMLLRLQERRGLNVPPIITDTN